MPTGYTAGVQDGDADDFLNYVKEKSPEYNWEVFWIPTDRDESPKETKKSPRIFKCENCGKMVDVDGETSVHSGCDFVWGRRGWRQLGAYDG